MKARLRFALAPAFGGSGTLVEVEPRRVVWSRGTTVVSERPGGVASHHDPIQAVEAELESAGPEAIAVGFASYELAAALDPLVAAPAGNRALPDAWWAVIDRDSARPSPAVGSFRRLGALSTSLDADQYRAAVETIRSGIAAGEYYQVNLTRRWNVGFEGDAAALLRQLQSGGSATYACFLEDRDQGWAVCCRSPELLLARRGDAVETRPIKGTRARGGIDDEAAARELAASEKDAAELAMIVDLERNDLNRVCRPDSVRVVAASNPLVATDVVHREAIVVGRLTEGIGWRQLLTALLPGGSVTGAPKLAACRIIATLEPVPRSVYCGALGVLRPGGDGTLALPIRTGYMAGGTLCFHAGCGIVWDSDPAAEEAESRAKVRSWFAALEV